MACNCSGNCGWGPRSKKAGVWVGLGIAAGFGVLLGLATLTKAGVATAGLMQPEAEAQPDLGAMFEAISKPIEEHKHLEAFVGTWDAVMSFEMEPGGPEMQSTGVMVNTMIFGGRFLDQNFKGDLMGTPFEGRSVWGYSKEYKQYQATWIDSLGTTLFLSTGQVSQGGKVFTMTGEQMDPMSGEKQKYKDVITVVDANTNTFVRTFVNADGTEAMAFKIRYTRRK